MKKLLATAALVGMSGAALAAPVPATLVSVVSYSANGASTWTPTANNSGVWQFDAGTGVASMISGTYSYIAKVGLTPLMTHEMTGAAIGGGGAATAASWDCLEGAFGGVVGASICGNYAFGGNYVNDSTYTPTLLGATVTIGGDDIVIGPVQTFNNSYDNMVTTSLGGGQFKISNGVVGVGGYDFTFSAAVVPVPAAVWLFGSALGFLGIARRRMAA